jgi:hypothetical protein
LQLIKDIDRNIDEDFSKNIIAIWHDESHLNKYLLGKNIKISVTEYGYPEGIGLPIKLKIIILEKGRFGGHNWLRLQNFLLKSALSAAQLIFAAQFKF